MQIIATAIPDVLVLEPRVFGDERGFFFESWNQREFAPPRPADELRAGQPQQVRPRHPARPALPDAAGRRENSCAWSRAKSSTWPWTCAAISPTLGRWAGALLSAANRRMMWIPPGFAHGFYVTTESAEFVYKCTDFYAPEHEVSMRWDDPAIGIDWPLVDGKPPVLSAKDAAGISFAEAPKL